jgi:peptidyl-prolyl cis-trans isomerase C
MRYRTSLLAGAALAVILSLPANAEGENAETVLATVNGENITLGHVISTRMQLPQQYQALPDDVLFEGILEQLIQQTVLSQAIGEVSKRTRIQLENERRALAAGEHLDKVLSDSVTEETLQAAYDEVFANAEPTPEYNASHILVETEEEAAALIKLLEEGGDFATLAREHSTGPSGPNGGELGWFSEGMMVEPFEDAVIVLEIGQVSPPVETQFGWHVVILNDKRVKGAPALEEVRAELIELVENNAVEMALSKLLEAAEIERADTSGIDPALVRDITLIE